MTLTIMSGLPGSGKTTYCSNNIDKSIIVIHRDEWRDSERERMGVDSYYPYGDAKKEYAYWADHIASVMRANPGRDFCIDQTTLTEGAVIKLLTNLAGRVPEIFPDLVIRVAVMTTPDFVCIARNEGREGDKRVPDEVMRSMADSFCMNERVLQHIADSCPFMRYVENIVVDYIQTK